MVRTLQKERDAMIERYAEDVLPGVLVRWVRVPHGQAMVVTAHGMDLWICAAIAPVEAGWTTAIDEMRDAAGELAVTRYCAAFGSPWVDLSQEVIHAQFALVSRLEERVLEQLSTYSPEQVIALRQHVDGGRPCSVLRALKCLHDYSSLTQ